jgi:hypothetical protein
MPVTEIQDGKKYLLGVDPDAGYDGEVCKEILRQLNLSFPNAKFVVMSGLYSIAEAPMQGD